jgi:histidinol-phosphate aminotransferase
MTPRRRSPLRPAHLEGLDRYEPGLSLEQATRDSGLREVVKLASNENPLGPSPRALEAARSALERVHRYPDGPATTLREALARRLGVSSSQIVIGNGSTELIDLLARAFLGPEDNAVISEGAFARFGQVVRARNGRARLVPMRDLTHDLPAMRAAVDERTRLLYVANPNNPTGTWNRTAELEALLADLPADALLVLDEAYFEYADDPEYPDGLRWVRAGRPVAVLRTFSKVYGLAGLRVGYGVAASEVVEAVDIVREPFNSSVPGQAAALAALEDEAHVRRTLDLTRSERERLAGALRERGYRVLPSLTNFLFVDVGRDAAVVYRDLLARGVVVRPLRAYGFDTALRVSIGLPEENARLVTALDAVLAAPRR